MTNWTDSRYTVQAWGDGWAVIDKATNNKLVDTFKTKPEAVRCAAFLRYR